MSNSAKNLLTSLQGMPKNLMTKEVIIPLLEALDFFKVEFFGGTDEMGKEILCWEKDRLGGIRLITAQVKHFKFTNTASDKRSFLTVD